MGTMFVCSRMVRLVSSFHEEILLVFILCLLIESLLKSTELYILQVRVRLIQCKEVETVPCVVSSPEPWSRSCHKRR